jgi:hypothetical protein
LVTNQSKQHPSPATLRALASSLSYAGLGRLERDRVESAQGHLEVASAHLAAGDDVKAHLSLGRALGQLQYVDCADYDEVEAAYLAIEARWERETVLATADMVLG